MYHMRRQYPPPSKFRASPKQNYMYYLTKVKELSTIIKGQWGLIARDLHTDKRNITGKKHYHYISAFPNHCALNK